MPRFRHSPGLLGRSVFALCLLPIAALGCRGTAAPAPAPHPAVMHVSEPLKPDAIAAVGREIFFDPSLSGSGKLSCASCHDPAYAYAPANNRAVQLGGISLARAVFRAVPSLGYVLGRTPRWHQEHAASLLEQLEQKDNPPFGGFSWDGRFDTLSDQASFPLLSPNEMANASPAAILASLRRAPYAQAFERAFGKAVLADPAQAFAGLSLALQRFELTDPSFHPYTSKFDAALDGRATLSAQELRGEELFNDLTRGNCASCHTSARGADGSHPLFTNFQFEVLGVPRSPEIPANRDPRFYDLGLCGPLRKDLAGRPELCGMFKTPSLRNVATRGAFFHNGRFHTLRDALRFYVRRDTNPEEFYPVGRDGSVRKFDDLPAIYRGNVDVVDLPLTRHKGEQPVWSEQDIDDVIAFLNTLTDGYKAP